MRKWLTPPNAVTLFRMVLVPFILGAILEGEHLRALALFAAAAVTDALDGALARRFGWTSTAGAYLDPIADKALLSGLYLTLAVTGDIPWWLVGLIFGRDLLILAAAGLALLFTRLRAFPPSLWGKVSTIFQVLTAVAWMARNVTQSGVVEALAAALIWPTAAMTIWSGFHYGWRGFRMLRMH
ncbi:MAG TPA: CDP-alcohol phosphatidyltransferase family protein [Bryobacteraceae bacterium]|nr:CDP-alcohol phosphatidyltransferase family protein [Bryobacteraceae bacterium]